MSSAIRSIRLQIRGIVQGVGFRPFLHRLAEHYHLTGWVRNTSEGLEGVLEGDEEALDHFADQLRHSPPPLASIEKLDILPEKPFGYTHFSIEASLQNSGSTLVSPDVSICPECAAELYTPTDRRYRYPFINCTNCGPRYTIIESLPYDRKRTVMKDFPMCDDCSKEYENIRDRRYHAQPDCCPRCGPEVFYISGGQPDLSRARKLPSIVPGQADEKTIVADPDTEEDPFLKSQHLLSKGGILAVKGIGGIHLACNALDPSAVRRLRERKGRPSKPLAIMCHSMESVRRICTVTSEEAKLLESSARPIVLLSKKDRNGLTDLSFSPRLGVMLPYSPLHMLLTDGHYGGPDILVMTSGNISGCPVLTENEEALVDLTHIADGFLLHNRRIQNRCDDSLIMEWENRPYFFRKSRGYAPRPLRYAQNVDGIMAMGAEQKASFALGKDQKIFLSPHIGDLKNAETFVHYTQTLQTYRQLFHIKPSMYVCDLHPDYLSTQEAARACADENVPLLAIQHHWAHMAACMADNQLDQPCFGIIWDGTGLGNDGTIWGGECLKGSLEDFSRLGSIRPIALAGGDQAIREIGRIGLSLVRDADIPTDTFIPLSPEKRQTLSTLLKSGLAPTASSIGRLFDGVCSLVLGQSQVSYEGEGAALLEAILPTERWEDLVSPAEDLCWPLHFYDQGGLRIFDTRPLTRSVLSELEKHTDAGSIALRFMVTLCYMALDQCQSLNPEKLPVVLSGGVFQNRFLLSGITALLQANGFHVYIHRQTAPNDEGICLGQLAIAQKKRSLDHVFGYSDEN